MWSGFNLIANLDFWNALPERVKDAVDRAMATHAQRQREYTEQLNRSLPGTLERRGMKINVADAPAFRRALSADFYRRWKTEFGPAAWRLLEDAAGKLA
jgi:TRAP-type C4-dicarboxylate transport system substrate-binding protein